MVQEALASLLNSMLFPAGTICDIVSVVAEWKGSEMLVPAIIDIVMLPITGSAVLLIAGTIWAGWSSPRLLRRCRRAASSWGPPAVALASLALWVLLHSVSSFLAGVVALYATGLMAKAARRRGRRNGEGGEDGELDEGVEEPHFVSLWPQTPSKGSPLIIADGTRVGQVTFRRVGGEWHGLLGELGAYQRILPGDILQFTTGQQSYFTFEHSLPPPPSPTKGLYFVGAFRRTDNCTERPKEVECPICLSEFVCPRMLCPCGHEFCADCAFRWFAQDQRCPLCMRQVEGMRPLKDESAGSLSLFRPEVSTRRGAIIEHERRHNASALMAQKGDDAWCSDTLCSPGFGFAVDR